MHSKCRKPLPIARGPCLERPDVAPQRPADRQRLAGAPRHEHLRHVAVRQRRQLRHEGQELL